MDILFLKEKLEVAYIVLNWFSSNLPLISELCVSVKNVKPPFSMNWISKTTGRQAAVKFRFAYW